MPKKTQMIKNINAKVTLWSVLGVVALILILMFGMPVYRVWAQEMSGRAEYAKAEQNRKIKKR